MLTLTNVFLSLGVALGAFVAYSILSFYARVRKAAPLPGPPPHWPLGSLAIMAGGTVAALNRMKEYLSPDGACALFMFSKQTLVVTHHEHLKEILSVATSRAESPGLRHHFERFLGKYNLTLMTGEEWKWHRRLMFQAFKFAQLQVMAQDMRKCLDNLVSYLDNVPANQPFDLERVLKALTFDVIGVTAFGCDMQSIDCLKKGQPLQLCEAFQFLLRDYGRRLGSLNPTDFFYWLPTATNRKHASSKKLLYDKIDSIVTSRFEARARGEQNHQDFLEHILASLDANNVSSKNRENAREIVVDNIFVLLFAGFDTSSLLLTFAFYLLAKYPEVLAKLQSEVDRVLQNEPVQFKHQAQLKYTTMVIKEVLRLYPPAPMTARQLPHDMKIAGQIMKAGTDVWIATHLVHRSKHNYFEPERFWPERWEKNYSSQPSDSLSVVDDSADAADGVGEASLTADAKAGDRIPNFAWVPFSAGPRDCLGFRFAMLESTLVLAHLVRRYQFRLAPGFELELGASSIVQSFKNGLWAVCEKRT